MVGMVTQTLRSQPALDVAAYLARIGHAGSVEPTLATLHGLVTAHLTHIPFENLDPLMGIPVADLSAEALGAKMVQRARGGYCFEQNGLLAYALEELGYAVESLTARVVWMRPEGLDAPTTPLTHQLLVVRVPGDPRRFLVDVGFGGQTLTAPIEFVPGLVQQTPNEPYRIGVRGDEYFLETLIGDVWQPVYIFADSPRPAIDLQVGSWYVSTHPASIFVVGLTASMIIDGARWNLRGRHLAIHRPGEPGERVRFENASQVLALLMNTYGLDVGGIGDVHQRITEVLDS
ncbi:arylamine N-acetyltransferase [Mycolicibacterium chitae]|uniref:Arylamine N-acetyltransferase n=2 Tax=Mycolicibacterium chitae TaxID=1792 RepID=A0A448ICD5_MYCCI|nr:arylamine N-acetyltransferase [Mycolicibacterium chitae]VEG50116.1 arylamine N-acetyltransferase [Mycolicibacterium chitae]